MKIRNYQDLIDDEVYSDKVKIKKAKVKKPNNNEWGESWEIKKKEKSKKWRSAKSDL